MENKNSLHHVAEILGNGYKCYLNKESGEVFQADAISIEDRGAEHYLEYNPLESKIIFGFMQDFCAQVEDFGKQSELMEALLYNQPFQSFKNKTYNLGLADDWIAYRTERIVEVIS